jgi:hypothetical protein
MKRIYIKTATVLPAVLCLLLAGCVEDDTVSVSAVSVKEAKYVGNVMQISLKDNETLQLTPFVMPRNAENQDVTYSNKYPSLMSVSATGLVTALGIGKDTLTVTSVDNPDVSVSYLVDIADHKVKATAINVTAAGSNITLKEGGKTFDLAREVSLSPADTWEKTVAYSSSNSAVADISAAGLITSGVEGTAVITIATTDGSNLTRNCNVTVLGLVRREVDLDRAAWTVRTSVSYSDGNNYVADGTTGLPAHLFDDNAATFLSMVKPGKTYGSALGNTPGYELYFIVDMQKTEKFGYVRWQHRQGNNYAYLRAWGVNVSGSNDGSNWTAIGTGISVPIEGITPDALTTNVADNNIYHIELDGEYEYRYVKIDIVKWSDNSGGSTSGSTVQVGEFGLGYIYFE